MVFIDGGHSIDTIKHDLESVLGSGTIILDDFYEEDEFGKNQDISKFGCNSILSDYNYQILPIAGRVSGGGLVRMVRLK